MRRLFFRKNPNSYKQLRARSVPGPEILAESVSLELVVLIRGQNVAVQ